MIAANTVIVQTVATRIVEVPSLDCTVYIGLGAGETIYIGNSDVTTSTGFVLTGTSTFTLDGVGPNDVIYGIASANTTVNVLVRGGGNTEPEFGVAP